MNTEQARQMFEEIGSRGERERQKASSPKARDGHPRGSRARAQPVLLMMTLAVTCVPGAEAQILPEGIFLERVTSGLQRPIDIANAGDGSDRLFIVEQTGRIRIYDPNQDRLLPTPFLDLAPVITSADFEGVLGLTFHPQYEVNGRFFVVYIDTNYHQIVARFSVSGDPNVANPTPDAILLDIPHTQVPFPHYGGQLQFGPDGYLYASIGDGGIPEDPENRGQRLDVLYGKLLRLDVDSGEPYAIPPDNPFLDVPDARGEIWALGLRNPHKFSFDRETGEMFVTDVGEGRREEVNHQDSDSPGGANYGWRRMEGSICFIPSSDCNDGTLTLPAFEYAHSSDPCGGSIAGGYRYRGARFPQMDGVYLFGDFCFWDIYGAVQEEGTWSFSELLHTGFNIVTFGEDEAGEIYVPDFFSGVLYRVAANNPVPMLAAVSPEQVEVGGPEFTLTVQGSGFVPNSVVNWNGSSRATTFASTSELSATILASDIDEQGAGQVTVFNPAPVGGTSNALSVAVEDNRPPVAEAGADQTVDATALSDMTATASVTLDASASTDPDGDPLTFRWLEGATEIATGSRPTITLAAGVHRLTLEVSDGTASDADEVVVTVVDFALAAQCQGGSPSCNGATEATLEAGQSVSFDVTATGVAGTYDSDITFTCEDLPALTTCTFAPDNTLPGAPPEGSSVTVRIQTTATAAASLEMPGGMPTPPPLVFLLWMGVPGLALLAVVLAGDRSKRCTGGRLLARVLMMGIMLAAYSACSSDAVAPSQEGTPPGTYDITIRAAGAGTIDHSVELVVIVQ